MKTHKAHVDGYGYGGNLLDFNRGMFVRSVREALGVSQRELADCVGLTQSALARFERSQTSLRPRNLGRLANCLGISTEFLQTAVGGPFLPQTSSRPIKLFLTKNQEGRLDFSLLISILRQSSHSILVFIIPDYMAYKPIRYKRERSQDMYLAIIVCDDNYNLYVFKRKDHLLFDRIGIVRDIRGRLVSRDRHIEVYSTKAPRQVHESILNWDYLDPKDCQMVISTSRRTKDRLTMRYLVDSIWSHNIMASQKDIGDKIINSLENMNDDEVQRILKELLPILAEHVRACLPPT